MKREQAIVREIVSMISIVACCHSAKLCAHAARIYHRNTITTNVFNKFFHQLMVTKICPLWANHTFGVALKFVPNFVF